MHPAIKGIIFRQDNLSKQTGGEIIFPKFGADDPKIDYFRAETIKSHISDEPGGISAGFVCFSCGLWSCRLTSTRTCITIETPGGQRLPIRNTASREMKREKYAVFTIDVEDFADTECCGKVGSG